MKTDKIPPCIPLRFKVLTVITALPLFAWPWLMRQAALTLGDMGEDSLSWTFVMLLPLYVVLSTWISYRVYSSWRVLAWILQVLQVMVYIALWILVQYGLRIV